MIGLVKEYNSYIENLPKLIKKSYFKAEYFLQHLNVSEATFYRKIRQNAFTNQEVQKITELLYPNEVILDHLKQSETDIKEGRVEAHEVVKQKLKIKHFS